MRSEAPGPHDGDNNKNELTWQTEYRCRRFVHTKAKPRKCRVTNTGGKAVPCVGTEYGSRRLSKVEQASRQMKRAKTTSEPSFALSARMQVVNQPGPSFP